MTPSRLLTAAAIAVATASSPFLASPVAALTCAPDPPRSEHAFVGTVTSVGPRGLVAQVVRQDGGVVEVRGGDPSKPDPLQGMADRLMKPGERYEFHPAEAVPPFTVHLCDATRLLGAGPVPMIPVAPVAREPLPLPPLPDGELDGSSALPLAAASAGGAAGLLALGWAWRRTRREN